jgi:hypothetical protein
MKKTSGHLVIIGGAEDREDGDKPGLQRFVELLPRRGTLFVLTAATEQPDKAWKTY